MAENLTHSEFSNCIKSNSGPVNNISCTTIDGKYTVSGVSHPVHISIENGHKKIVNGEPDEYTKAQTYGPLQYLSNDFTNVTLKNNSNGKINQMDSHGVNNRNNNQLFINSKSVN